MSWLSITVELDVTQAEALSEALIEAGAASVDLEPLRQGMRLTALASRDADASALLQDAARTAGIAAPEFEARALEDDDWVRRSQSQFGPLRVGDKLWIVPTWHTPPAAPAITVRLDPGLAFGTGSHASTRLILNSLEDLVRGGERILDYGCGSGILAIAAARLGGGAIDAVDIDPQALEVTRANARLNGIALQACLPGELPAGDYDIVLANILAGPLIELAGELTERTRPGGRVLLCGILETQAAEVRDAYKSRFSVGIRAQVDAWVLLEGIRK